MIGVLKFVEVLLEFVEVLKFTTSRFLFLFEFEAILLPRQVEGSNILMTLVSIKTGICLSSRNCQSKNNLRGMKLSTWIDSLLQY